MRISIRDVSKTFRVRRGKIAALDKVSLEIDSSEFMGIVGPNGCGKTTLLRIIAGHEQPTSGSVEFIGAREPESRYSMVWQKDTLLPWRIVETNVALPPEIRRKPETLVKDITRRFLRVGKLVGTESLYPYQLSAGMKQRAQIARALANLPELVLMDEPFGSLDAQTRFLMMEQLTKIWEADRKTIVYVTHNLEEAVLLCDRIAVMTSRPGSVKEVMKIAVPRPRGVRSYSDPNFAETLSHIWDLLREEVERSLKDSELQVASRARSRRYSFGSLFRLS